MATTRKEKKEKLVLEFDPKQNQRFHEKDLREGLSSAVRVGKNLWLAPDDGSSVERLTQISPRTFGRHRSFPLRDYFPIPGSEKLEIEGLAAGGGYLWACGSHSSKRNQNNEIQPKLETFLLGRIPLVSEEHDQEEWRLAQTTRNRTAATFFSTSASGDEIQDELTKALRDDPILSPFCSIPEKENGLDIEGIATHGKRLFLGLRGPVVQGMAVVLSLEVEEYAKGRLRPLALEKHFLPLRGLGVRELRFAGPDLLLLAGPSLVLNIPFVLYRWKNAARARKGSIVSESKIEKLKDLPLKPGGEHGLDRPEGMSLLDSQKILLLHDKPVPSRLAGEASYQASVLRVA